MVHVSRVCCARRRLFSHQISDGARCKIGVCEFDGAAGKSKCVAYIAAGQPCGEALDKKGPASQCRQFHFCFEGKCTLEDPALCK
jgi:hypothetical protein